MKMALTDGMVRIIEADTSLNVIPWQSLVKFILLLSVS